ncbi:MAG: hypothetical protein Q9219_001997 [cf. Caloplaca sp. 3 TL-2023]
MLFSPTILSTEQYNLQHILNTRSRTPFDDVMATCTFWSFDLCRALKLPKESILDQVKLAERKTFPRNEAFDFDTELRKRNAELLVLLDTTDSISNPSLVAYAVYVHTAKVALLHKVCVLEKYRRQGVARRMLVFHHERLARRDCGKVELWVDEDRIAAKQLYESIGFEVVSRVEDYYGPSRTALRMVLRL